MAYELERRERLNMHPRPFVLWLIWQNTETRQRYHIGNLSYLNGTYTFTYELNGERRTVTEAMANGYRPHLAFRDIQKTYVSERLFNAFSRRLPDKRRPDFQEVLQSLGLSNEYTELDLLRATGGRLATDPYEFVTPIFKEHHHFDFEFYVAGWRYYDGDQVISELRVGDEVQMKLDPDNPEDHKAVVIMTTQSGAKLGFIPAFYSGFMFDVIRNNGTFKTRIEGIYPSANAQRKVSVSVVGQLNQEDTYKLDYWVPESDSFLVLTD